MSAQAYTHTEIASELDFDPTEFSRLVKALAPRYTRRLGNKAALKAAVVAARGLTAADSAERARRFGLHYAYIASMGFTASRQVVRPYDGSGDMPFRLSSVVVDFAAQLKPGQNTLALEYKDLKGFGCEVAHVVQKGDWRADQGLQREIRHLSRDPQFAEKNMRFTHVYDRHPDAIETRLHPAHGIEELDEHVTGLAVRKRRIADLSTARGQKIELIKRTVFLTNPYDMSPEQQEIHRALLGTNDPEYHRYWAARLLAPWTSTRNNGARDNDPSVLPVSSMLLALRRVE